MTERSTYVWNAPSTQAGRRALAARLVETGCTRVWLKAGGDNGYIWTPTQPNPPSWLQPQWQESWIADFAPLEVLPWMYNWPGEADKTAVLRALAHRAAPVLALNPETEWRVHSQHSPYNTLAEGNRYAEAWVRSLRAQLPQGTRVGFSGVPSWADFPYEGFAAACDFGHPQHYWPAELLQGEDQVEAHYRRAPGCPCIPILTACGEYDDAGVLRLAASAMLHPIEGFSSWEAGNAAWQDDAMRQAYALLPVDNVVRVESPFLRMWRHLFAA